MKRQVNVLRKILYSSELYDWTWSELVQSLDDAESGAARALIYEEMDFRRTWAE